LTTVLITVAGYRFSGLLFWLTNLPPTVLTGLLLFFLLTRFINYDCEILTDSEITETED